MEFQEKFQFCRTNKLRKNRLISIWFYQTTQQFSNQSTGTWTQQTFLDFITLAPARQISIRKLRRNFHFQFHPGRQKNISEMSKTFSPLFVRVARWFLFRPKKLIWVYFGGS
jgi:hypothetical protein